MYKRVNIEDVSNETMKEDLIDLAINIAIHNDDFICSECIRTLEKILNLISLYTPDDEEYREIVEEVQEITGQNFYLI